MNPIYALLAQYGIEFVIELVKIIESKNDVTSADLIALKEKYASKSADKYLEEAKARAATPPA